MSLRLDLDTKKRTYLVVVYVITVSALPCLFLFMALQAAQWFIVAASILILAFFWGIPLYLFASHRAVVPAIYVLLGMFITILGLGGLIAIVITGAGEGNIGLLLGLLPILIAGILIMLVGFGVVTEKEAETLNEESNWLTDPIHKLVSEIFSRHRDNND